jgi:hypothetical protein
MTKSKTNLFLPLVFTLFCINTFAQDIYEPLVIIKEDFNSRNYRANDEYCLHFVQPKYLVNDSEFRAYLIKKRKIKSIKYIKESDFRIDSFNTDGQLTYKAFYENDSLIRYNHFNNEFNIQGYVIKKPSNFKSKDQQEIFKYDSKNQLVKYIEKFKIGFLKRSIKRVKNYKYDDLGNILELEGIKTFSYDNLSRLKLIEEINVYGERFSKSNEKNKKKSIYGNRQFKEYYYNSIGQIDKIEINHYDSLTYGNYHIEFEYNNSKKLTRITKFHASGEKWKMNELRYSGELLTSNTETIYSGTSDNYSIVELKYFYRKGMLSKIERYWSNKRVNRELSSETYYEYTYY